MEAVSKRPQSSQIRQFLSTRKGAYTVAAIAAALAALVLVVFISQYKESVKQGLVATPVLVADRVIPRGTAGSDVVLEKLFKPTAVAEQDLKPGALTDSEALVGAVAVRTILPGQQITGTDFTAKGDPIRSRISKNERAIQIPIDKVHGLLGTVRPSDRVDIMAAFNSSNSNGSGTPTLTPLMRDVRIMAAPGYSPGIQSSVILEVTDKQASQLAFAADNAKLWFTLRPPVGARDSDAVQVNEDSLLSGGRPYSGTIARGTRGGGGAR